MSKKEREDGRLDLRPLYGAALSVGLLTAGVAWVLTRHKNKKREEKLEELDYRDQLRCEELTRKIQNLKGELWEAGSPREKALLKDLIKQAEALQAELKAEAHLPPSERLRLEEFRELAAEIEDRLVQMEDPSYRQ